MTKLNKTKILVIFLFIELSLCACIEFWRYQAIKEHNLYTYLCETTNVLINITNSCTDILKNSLNQSCSLKELDKLSCPVMKQFYWVTPLG